MGKTGNDQDMLCFQGKSKLMHRSEGRLENKHKVEASLTRSNPAPQSAAALLMMNKEGSSSHSDLFVVLLNL